MGGDVLVANAIIAQTTAQTTALGLVSTNIALQTTADVTQYGIINTETVSNNVVAIAEIAAHAALMVAQYNLGTDAIDDRDAAIDKQINFMQQIQDLKTVQDLPMLLCKKDVLLDLVIPSISFCNSDFGLYLYSSNDGSAVDGKSSQLASQALGVPSGWLLHEGLLKGMKTVGYTQGIEKNAEKRRVETLRKSKSRLVRGAQSTIKSQYNSADILNKYTQVGTIHGSLADLYMQGFNSSGAALGVALGRLSNKNADQTGG